MRHVGAFAIGGSIVGIGAIVVLAGPLNPPGGPVASTYKSLAEIEPRIAVNATNTPGDADSVYRISSPGSYYLTANLTGAAGKRVIEIASSRVTLDLMGHAVIGGPGSLDGIETEGIRDGIAIRNGSVMSCGRDGIELDSHGYLVERVQVSGNGQDGIDGGEQGIILDCSATLNGAIGISSLWATRIERCVSRDNGTHGITVGSNGAIVSCRAIGNVGDGIRANDFNCLVRACVANENQDNGIYAWAWCLLEGNVCNGNDMGGIRLDSDDNVAQDNQVSGNGDYGLSVGGQRNLIVRNHARGNATANYHVFDQNNFYGTIVDSESAMNVATNEDVNWSF